MMRPLDRGPSASVPGGATRSRLHSVGHLATAFVLTVSLVACGDEKADEAALGGGAEAPSDTLSEGGRSAGSDARPTARTEAVAEPGPIPPALQRDGDAALGRAALIDAPYVSCGLPLQAWRAARDAGGLDADASAVTLPGRTGDAAELPYFNNLVTDKRGVEQVAGNCLACHAAPLFGELVIGLGNEFADWTGDLSAPVERAGLFVSGADETAAWERYADRIAAIAPHARMATVGSNPANNITFALIAHRDPESNAWSDTPLLPLPSTTPPPVSVPPWWRMAKKHAMFNLGEGRGDHARIMMAAAMLCTDTREELDAIDAYAPDIQAYIASLEPPAWPFALDRALAERGQALFEQRCSACHGRYDSDAADGGDEYPNLLVPIEQIGTDPALMEQAIDAGTPWVDWWSRSYFGELSEALPGRGYVAPPLDGVWATAPYGHNGSVPNLALWLDSGARPALWRQRARDGNAVEHYDEATLGWHHDELDTGEMAELTDADRLRVYDTTRYGHGNGGHVFGDDFDDAERAAVLEYLKTL